MIFTAHVLDIYNDSDMVMETKVPVKGALKNNGLEAYFSTIVTARKVDIKNLEDYENDLLTISDEEAALGFKYVFQTKITKQTVHHKIRSSMGLWTTPETFIDNDAEKLMQRLHQYYS